MRNEQPGAAQPATKRVPNRAVLGPPLRTGRTEIGCKMHFLKTGPRACPKSPIEDEGDRSLRSPLRGGWPEGPGGVDHGAMALSRLLSSLSINRDPWNVSTGDCLVGLRPPAKKVTFQEKTKHKAGVSALRPRLSSANCLRRRSEARRDEVACCSQLASVPVPRNMK